MDGASVDRSRDTEFGRVGPTVHEPVLLSACLEGLAVRSGGVYIDGTGGGGGHALAMLTASAPEGRVIVCDRDSDALQRIEARFLEAGVAKARFHLAHLNFRNVSDVSRVFTEDKDARVDGILVDLGLSSDQLDTAERGFSFSEDGPLDMRMNVDDALTAAEIVNTWEEDRLVQLFFEYGEEPASRRIAKALVRRREDHRFERTHDLAETIAGVCGAVYRNRSRRHPATRVFQALRVAVNDELGSLADLLVSAPKILRVGGRLAVISFHSLEDRIVKRAFRGDSGESPWRVVTKRPLIADEDEVLRNPRSRSAKLRIGELVCF